MLFVEYEVLSKFFTGWSLSEFRNLARRERKYFIDLITKEPLRAVYAAG